MNSFYVIGVIAVVLMLVFLLIWRISASGERMLEEQRERIERARKAQAKILAVGSSKANRNDGVVIVRLNLEVFPNNLQPSFQTWTVWEVEPAMIGEIAAGKTMAVKFDGEDETQIYPTAPWAKFNFLRHKLMQSGAPSEV
jgi:hypothetical protein